LFLALSDDADRIPEDVRQVRLLPKLLEGYRGDPDPGIHGAIRLLLQRMGQSRAVRQVDEDLEGKGIVGDRRWFVDQGHTMVVIDPIGRDPFLSADRPIGRVFAISDREVTVEQFLRFRPDHDYNRRVTAGPDCPVGIITWYDAAAYCRWLDEQALIPEDQRCYPPIDEIKKGMRPRQGYLGRIGHRLPNYAEWEYSCRAGTSTVRYFGDRDELLPAYAWFLGDSGGRFHPVGSLKPNAFGLFDMHGNAFEWCQESVIHCNLNRDKDTEDLTAVTGDRERVIRSGAFAQPAEKIRSDYMGPLSPVERWDNLGFRVVRTIGAEH
jgi:formylglycine-generating enzyme required for sulfatase activity